MMTTDTDLGGTTRPSGTGLVATGLTRMTAETPAILTLATKTGRDLTRRRELHTTKRKPEARDEADRGLEVECVGFV